MQGFFIWELTYICITMSNGFQHNAPEDINLDISETNPEIFKTAKFIKNLTTSVNVNPDGTAQIAGNNQTTRTPLLSNELICNIELPEGDCYCIGPYNSSNSGDTYNHIWNSNGNHLIYRIRQDGACEIVYQGPCLNYQLQPQYFLPQTRNELFHKCQTNLFTNVNGYINDLVFTDGYSTETKANWQRMIQVEDSIATQSFTWPLTLLTSNPGGAKTVNFDACEYIELIQRYNMRCIGIREIENTELAKNNFLADRTWQFRVKWISVWNQDSEHGVISDMYIPSTSSCQMDANGKPRCLELTIDAGSPKVGKFIIEFRNCVSTNTNIETESDWFQYDVIDKYADCGANQNKNWFERTITLNEYDAETNTWKYIFCNEKDCTPIPVAQTNRTQNQLAITSGSIVRVGNGIALANNTIGYQGVPCEAIEALTVEYEAPDSTCKAKYCDIEFWAVIHNPFVNVNEFVYNKGGTFENSGFTGGDWSWGGIGKILLGIVPEINGTGTDYGQTFTGQTNNQRNFYAYLEGTDFKVQAFQQVFDGATLLEWGGQDMTHDSQKRQAARRIDNGSYYLQHFVFKNVPLGKYLVRLPGHNNSQDEFYQNSSTYVAGTIDKTNYISKNLDYDDIDTYYKELEINTCSFTGSVFSTSTMFVIMDLTCPDHAFLPVPIVGNSFSNVYYGYLKDSSNNPVELAPVVIDDVDLTTNANVSVLPNVTLNHAWATLVNKSDHNGFWFCAYAPTLISFSGAISFKYFVETAACASVNVGFSSTVDTLNADAQDIPLTVSDVTVTDYAKCRSITITGKITDCDNHPISGMLVCFTRSKSAKTNSNGIFTIVIHNDIDPDFSGVLGRVLGEETFEDRIFISQNGLCIFFDCDSCSMCVFIDYNIDINDDLDCFSCDGDDHKVLTVYTTKLRFPFSNQHGLRLGSQVKFGMKYYDAAGRHTFVGTDNHLILQVPKSQQQLSQLFGKVKYTMAPLTYPEWVAYVGFYWTDQIGYYDFLDFVINSVDINTTTGKITLGFQSIINYNTDNYFKTNTTWEFLQGDRIEFIADESGNFFDANNPSIGILNFQIAGNTANNSGIIDYDIRLANLKPGTLIQLQRPKECNKELFYWEICSPIKLVANRIPTDQLTGYFNIWNSYLVSRKIRYSVGGVDSIHVFSFLFESQAPSDFWAGNCANRGRVNTVNPYEQRFCAPMQVQLSDSYSTNLNGLSYFDDANTHQFDDNGFSSINAMVTKLNYVLFICAKSSFVAIYDDNTLKIDAQGRVVYTGLKFSKPNPQNLEVGCEVTDISTISKCNGNVMWIDRNNSALAFHNFSSVVNVAENKFYGYLITKINTVKQYNLNPQRQLEKIFVAGYDPEKLEYVLTQFDMAKYDSAGTILGPLPTYINDEVEINEQSPETFAFGIRTGTMRSFYSFLGECYGLFNDKFISFRFAKPYTHGIRNTNSFNKFYGIQCISTFEFVDNANVPDLIKRFQWTEIYRKNKNFFATKITTEANQLSEIPLSQFEVFDNFETSGFLCDVNTLVNPLIPELNTAPGRLMNGDTLSGKWIRVKLISDTATSDEYFEFQECIVFASQIPKSGSAGNPQ